MRTAFAIVVAAAAAAPSLAFAQTADKPIVVTITAKGCDPAEVTVPSGTVTFQIVNRSARALEWEILRGVEVVDERENIAPGFRQKLTASLPAGDYEMTCGLLSNARGKLVALNGDGSRTSLARKPTGAELIGSAAEFRVWQSRVTTDLARDANACAEAAAAGDAAKVEDKRAAVRMGALKLMVIDAKVGGRVAEVVARAAGPAGADAGPSCRRLADAVGALQEASAPLVASPADLIAGSVRSLRAAGPETSVLAMTLEGSTKVAGLFLPLVQQADASAGGELATAVAGAKDAARGGDAAAMTAAATTLAGELATVPGHLGFEAW